MLAKLINFLDPRNSLAARIGWVFGIISVVLSLVAGMFVASLSQGVIEQEIGALYASRAQHIADSIDLNIQSGIDTMRLTASVLGKTAQIGDSVDTERLIEVIRKHLSDAIWIGVIDRSGNILDADNNRLKGTNIADEVWFKDVRKGDYVSGPAAFPKLEELLAPPQGGPSHKFLLVSAPMVSDSNSLTGYSVAAFSIDWIEEIQRRAGAGLAGTRPIDIFILDEDGVPLNRINDGAMPPTKDFAGRIDAAENAKLSNRDLGSLTTDNYLVGYAKSKGMEDFDGTGWTVVIREAKSTAYLPAVQTAITIALSCLFLGLGLTLAAAFGTKYILRGLTKIAASADALRMGSAHEFVAISGNDEVARISLSLSTLFNAQKETNEQLADLNRDLDKKVMERTREVQRLSEETSNAAITRERLRMSRDLHDTLAHSMLAVLTQIRLIQKLYRTGPELVKEELGHAERAAQEGLNLAREAVNELRYFAVRDDGLEQAMKKLVKRLKERSEIEVKLTIDAAATKLAGPKIETVYRIIEEALHNVEKHADARNLILTARLSQDDPSNHKLTLTVEDDGKGFDPDTPVPGHFGLLGMKEQAEILSGSLCISSAIGNGTNIQVKVSV